MPEELVLVTRTKEEKPEGAVEDADAFREVARRCREYRHQLRRLQSILENVWQGQSKERFFYEYGFTVTPIEMFKLVEWLEARAKQIDERRVTIEYTVLVPLKPPWE